MTADHFHLRADIGQRFVGAVEVPGFGACFQLAKRRHNRRHAARQTGPRQFMGEMIDSANCVSIDGLFQAGHNFAGLLKIKVHQFAHHSGIAVAGGLELVKIHHSRGAAIVRIGAIQWCWY